VLVTGHQAFFTVEAMTNIAKTTLANLADFEAARECANLVKLK
jgi:D-lactate dehydrogenase